MTEPAPGYHGISYTQAGGAAAYLVKMRVSLLRDTGRGTQPV